MTRLMIGLAVLCSILLPGVAAPCLAGTLARLAPFEQELYTLGYDVFLANSNAEAAFQLAAKAVASRPRDIAWRRRAARSGEWAGKVREALEHWYVLAGTTRQPDAADNALRLARTLGDYRKVRQLLGKRNLAGNDPLLLEYVAASEHLGLTDEAIALLERHRRARDNRTVLEQLARLYESVGKPKEAISARLELFTTETPANDLLKAASLAFGSRDLPTAYRILSLGKDHVPAAEHAYWQNLADLAWSQQDLATTEMASSQLLATAGARDSDYLRLIMLARETRVPDAYGLALQGWRRFVSIDFLQAACELGIGLHRQRELATVLQDSERSGALKPQEQGAYFWSLAAQVYRGAGFDDASVRSQWRAVRAAPGDGDTAAAYVWLLLDLDRRDDVRRILHAWQGHTVDQPVLREAFGAAWAYLGDYRQALPYFQEQYAAKRFDPGWLAAYADILEQSGWHEAAFVERVQASSLVRKQVSSPAGVDGQTRLRLQQEYARMAMHVAPGDALQRLMADLGRKPADDASRELVVAWALAGQRNDLARLWYWREYTRMARQPRWVELSLALEDNDQPRIARLLAQHPAQLPYRDAIEGARRTGAIPLAETMAFERMQELDGDHLLDRQLRELAGTRPGGVLSGLSLMDQGGVWFASQQLALATAASNRLTVRLAVDNTEIRHRSSGVIGLYPSRVQTVQAGLSLRHEKGHTTLLGGYRNALTGSAMATLQGDWQLDSRQVLEFSLQVGATADESARLRIGGLKDEARFAYRQRLTPRDTLVVQAAGRSLRDQERHALGSGSSLDGEWTHRLVADWPDILLRAYGGYHDYRQRRNPVGNAYLLIPGGSRTIADASWFVPNSFAQAGVGIQIGQDGRTSYVRQWQPFLTIDTGWNSRNRLGFRYEAGVVGPVLGLDQLEWFFGQESGTFGGGNITSRMDLRYRYFFE